MNNHLKNIILTPVDWMYRISPKNTLKFLFRLKQGYRLDLKNPKTLSEKIQWIKLYEHNSIMPVCCDKYEVREYVKQRGCGEILNELLWEGFDPNNIPFDRLPDKFVIKATHGSTFNIICRDKSTLDKRWCIKQCKKWLNEKFLECYGEWFYGVVKPRIIIEKYLENEDRDQLIDYKIMCFNGKAQFIGVYSDRFTSEKIDFYTCDWNRIEGVRWKYPNSNNTEARPYMLEQMITYAEKLSSDFDLARVDFYEVNNKVIFGEITFTPASGFDRFYPYEFDLEMGAKLSLPIDR